MIPSLADKRSDEDLQELLEDVGSLPALHSWVLLLTIVMCVCALDYQAPPVCVGGMRVLGEYMGVGEGGHTDFAFVVSPLWGSWSGE